MDKINNILAKYWEGTTSLAEEQELQTYFASDQVDESHQSFQALFDFFKSESTVTNPLEADNDIDTLLEKYWEGNSNLVEEALLKDYFAQGNISEKHLEFAPLFDFFNTEAMITDSSNDSNDIDLILEKYWEGNSSLVEEAALKDYFAQGAILEKHLEYAPLFDFLKTQVSISSSISDEAHINAIDTKAIGTKAIGTKAVDTKASTKVRKLYLGKRLMATAASILLLAMVFFAVKDNVKPPYEQETVFSKHAIENPEEALAVTMEALSFLSKNLDHNTTQIKRNFKSVAKADILK